MYSYIRKVFPDFNDSTDYLKTQGITLEKYDNTVPVLQTQNQSQPQIQAQTTIPIPITKQDSSAVFQENKPIVNLNANSNLNVNTVSNIHSESIKHSLECPECRQKILHTLQLDEERLRNEEYMELGSFFLYGMFLYLTIDLITKSKNK